ncbi:hypothetical protein BdWA1_000549 [Babesia duncani]|uniref:Uncharacterized protein n=1 Tax=Babesia duncani TaxID=323732 RepID=A0AAD9UQ59_9APIC|nr:hypothetical protein BdWA1_000549 [Babesia duncani]
MNEIQVPTTENTHHFDPESEEASLALAKKLEAELNEPQVRPPDSTFRDCLYGDDEDARLQEAIAKSLIDM